jgi:catechol 2,3-dioxygenase-like lactoylglutathione lyase family enzyme
MSGLILGVMLVVFPAAALELDGLDHYAVNVSSLQRSADWYHDKLGFNILHKWNTTWMVGKGNIKVGLFLRPDAKPPADSDKENLIQHVAFLVDGDKFTDVLKELQDKGVKIQGPEDTGIAFSFFFNDPDGILLEVTSYHDLPPPAPPAVPAPAVPAPAVPAPAAPAPAATSPGSHAR